MKFTFFPLINQVICGAGCAFDVVQFAINFSPMKNCRFLNVILGGPVCGTGCNIICRVAIKLKGR